MKFKNNNNGNVVPPDELKKLVGSEKNFETMGEHHLQSFIKLVNLKSDETVLDVGCGSGRIAIPLATCLTKGKYEGFDINKNAIDWCKDNIEKKFKNFHFTFIDVGNKHYNKKGSENASNLKFPYEDESFNFVFLTSIFTHLLPSELENYLSEVSRVLRKGGRCYITYFLLNEDSRRRMERSDKFNFKYKHDGFYSLVPEIPERAIAYEEEFIRNLYEPNNLTIIEPIYYGAWSGLKNTESGQDIILATK